MNKKMRRGTSKAILMTAGLFLLFATAFDLSKCYGDVIDQRWETPNSSHDRKSYSIKNNNSLGQEYTAGMNNITGVALSIVSYTTPPFGISTFDVKIRDNTISGQILASGTNTIEFTATSSQSERWLYFDFGGAVPISAGNRYVIEATMPSGSGYWLWNSWTDADGIGLPGRLIRDGQFVDAGYAFGFRTYAVPEPGTILLLGFGAAMISKKAKLKR